MRIVIFALVAVVTLLSVPAGAAVVTVTPNPQPTDTPVGHVGLGETTLTNSWSIVTNALGFGKLCGFGPSTYQSRQAEQYGGFYAQQQFSDPWFADQDLGRGAFYATCDMTKGTGAGDFTPSTVWLGADHWNPNGDPGQSEALAGKTLGSITQLDYFSFVSKTPVRIGGDPVNELGGWGASSWWNGPQQPIQLQLTIYPPSNPFKVKQVWYRPWGSNYVGDDGLGEPGSKKGRWQRFNCLTTGKWYYPSTGTTPDTVEQGWASWADMMVTVKYSTPMSQWVFAHPSTDPQNPPTYYTIDKSPGWNGQTNPTGSVGFSTGTGKPLNLFVGARVTSVTGGFLLQGSGTVNWVNLSYGERAQVDYFSIGFSGQGAATYDFEPAATDPSAHIMASSFKGLDTLRTPTMAAANPWNGNLYRITGRVGFVSNQWFELEDGSNLQYEDWGFQPGWTHQILPGPIRVYIQPELFRGDPWWINGGELVTVWGYVEPLRFTGSPLMMWSNINNITLN